MTKRERVTAALGRKTVDRAPVSFWRHAPDVDHTARGLAGAMLDFQRRWDLDFIKVMSSGVYCVEDWGCKVAYTGARAADWARLRPLDPGAGALGRELEALRLIVDGKSDDAPVLHTIFSPLTIARKLAGDQLAADLAQNPKAVLQALEVITDTVIAYAMAAVAAGADGFFVATQTGSPDVMTREDKGRFGLLYLRRLLESLEGKSDFTLLHIHGKNIYFDELAALPAHAEDAIRQTGGVGLMVAPGCGLPLDVPDAHLEAAVSAVKGSGA